MTHFDIADVRHYYDRHTRSFIRFGQGGRAGAIHRAVWRPGVHPGVERADLACAIESFVHAPAPGPVLAAWARLIRPEACWWSATTSDGSPTARPRRAPSIGSAAAVSTRCCPGTSCRPARELPGSSTNRAWTSRRRWRFTARATVSSPDCARRPNGSRAAPAVFDYLQGGSALQECLANGWIGYDLTVFRRRE